MLTGTTPPQDAVARSEDSMTEFVALVAVGVIVVGLGVLVAACLLTGVGWLVLRRVRRGRPTTPRTNSGENRFPGGDASLDWRIEHGA
jgi:hypothetical protein